MAEAKQSDEWNQTALLAAILANANRDQKKRPRPYEIKDFHPLLIKKRKAEKKSASFFFSKFGSFGVEVQETKATDPWAVQT